MILARLKPPLRYVKRRADDWVNRSVLTRRLYATTIDERSFDFERYRARVLDFLASMRVDGSPVQYRYSAQASRPTLYASTYACLTLSLLGKLDDLDTSTKNAWTGYFDESQSAKDGLFYDPVVANEIYADSDWWGARHLALHLIAAFTALHARPAQPFRFLEAYYDPKSLRRWLDSYRWDRPFSDTDDIDNKLMNVGALLQYQRDNWHDADAGRAVDCIRDYLLERIDPRSGMWGGCEPGNAAQRSRMVQFAYHLFPLFLYDGMQLAAPHRIVANTLDTQNALGGYGTRPNSSACEDIDSIDILVRFAPRTPELADDIDASLRKAFRWLMCNQVGDGGFVFRLNERMVYGHPELASSRNCGALFPTWFRTLAIAYLARHFGIEGFTINSCPGLEF